MQLCTGMTDREGRSPLRENQGVRETEEFTGFRGGDARVGGEFVEVLEAGARRPGGESGFAELAEMLLEPGENCAGVGIARGNRAPGARVAALEGDFADGEADDAALVFTEETIFPEGR